MGGLTLALVSLGGGHVPNGHGNNVRGLALAGVVDDLDDPVIVGRGEVLLEQLLNLGPVPVVLAALGGHKVGPQALLVDGGEDALDHGGEVVRRGLADLGAGGVEHDCCCWCC